MCGMCSVNLSFFPAQSALSVWAPFLHEVPMAVSALSSGFPMASLGPPSASRTKEQQPFWVVKGSKIGDCEG